ncbi:hypothetical protein [uncultured Amphritea sp.]|uniref:hypothetical protein n=1 Tax=uncultured Amphritea sp. TaxID=981605 RepID=UPI0025FE0E04|nr:hypothetical protein [uncultured Amphritea sp.]
MIKFLHITFLLLITNFAFADKLVISPSLYIDYDSPILIYHSGDTLLVKFDSWSFTHEDIDPKTIYQGIDLSGLERDFIESLFVPERRKDFPSWLAALSTEQAESLHHKNADINIKDIKNIKLYSSYLAKLNEGNIFILEERSVHRIQVKGDIEFYKGLLESIKER